MKGIYFIVHERNLEAESFVSLCKRPPPPLLPGFNFTNFFMYSFYVSISQKYKMTDYLSVFFALWGSMGLKATRKMLLKSTPDDVNVR